MRATSSEPSPSTRAWAGAAVVVLAVVALGAACSSSSTSSSAGSTSTTRPGADALLARLTTEGSDAALPQRYAGKVGTGDDATFVFVGRDGDRAVTYVCDGTDGTWFSGSVDGRGAGTLRATDGDATAALTPTDAGVQVTISGGTFDGDATTATPLGDGEGSLVRIQATTEAGGTDAAVGGVIVLPDGVRGTLRTATDGTSNTLAFPGSGSRTVTDGQSNTIIVGEATSSTTTSLARSTTTATGGVTDGQSNTIIVGEGSSTTTGSPSTGGNHPQGVTIIVSKTLGGVLTISVTTTAKTATTTTTAAGAGTTAAPSSTATTAAPTTTTTARPATTSPTTSAATASSTCAAQAATLQELVRALTAVRTRLEQQTAKLTGAGATAAKRQIDQLSAQIAELQRQIPTCR